MFHVPAHKNTQNPPAQIYPASELNDFELEMAIHMAECQQQRRSEEFLAGGYEYY
jgi:hypothetical protein